MSAVRVPTAPDAERVVAAGCAASSRGARLAHERLAPRDFYDTACRRIFEASVLPEVEVAEGAADISDWLAAVADGRIAPDASVVERLLEPGVPTLEARLEAIARLADVPLDELRRWVDGRPVHADTGGDYAARVADAAWRRWLMRACADLHRTAAGGDAADLGDMIVALHRRLGERIDATQPRGGRRAG